MGSHKRISIVGQKFNMLTVLENCLDSKGRYTRINCRCDCGEIINREKYRITNGTIKSCGCARGRYSITHPELYNIHRGMKSRCNKPTTVCYKDYGGRGIKVCDKWLGKDGFENFMNDMGARPENKTLDRIDVNGNYEPSNCRWATNLEQQNNKRDNRFITYNGKTQSVADWSRGLGYKSNELATRLMRYTFEEAISVSSTYGCGRHKCKRLGIIRQKSKI